MEKKNWHGILKLLELTHEDAHGNIVSEQRNLLNLLHLEGEEFILRAAFAGGRISSVIPETYCLGLDNRQSVTATQTIDDLIGEPTGGGYERAEISSDGDFSINFETNHFLATSPIVAFRATTGSWGPVSNLFLATSKDNSGILISTIVLQSPISLNSGDAVTMRVGLQLKECSTTTTASAQSNGTGASFRMTKKRPLL